MHYLWESPMQAAGLQFNLYGRVRAYKSEAQTNIGRTVIGITVKSKQNTVFCCGLSGALS